MQVADVQEIEAAVGQHDPDTVETRVGDACGQRRSRQHFRPGLRPFARDDARQRLGFGYRRADRSNDDAGGGVGEAGGIRARHTGSARETHDGGNGVTGTGHVEDVVPLQHRNLRVTDGAVPAILVLEEIHPFGAPCDEQSLEPETTDQRLGTLSDGAIWSGRFGEFSFVRRQYVSAAVLAEVAAFGIDQDDRSCPLGTLCPASWPA
ncbi:MAG TPA: hypothetical protein VLU24_03905, partial [Mycobacterium sp.]|nr:hypothetical protein [Mycobacterium sp.]